MGSLTSAPKAPKPVVIQQSAPPATDVITQQTSKDPVDVQREQSEERTRSLLARSRSRLGTIATGFRGLLQENSQASRKTLLGE